MYNSAMRNELKRVLLACLGVALLQLVAHAENKPSTTNSVTYANGLTNQAQKVSYAIGMNLGNNLKRMGAEVDVNLLTSGLQDTLGGKELRLTEQQAAEILRNYQREMMTKRQEEAHKMA